MSVKALVCGSVLNDFMLDISGKTYLKSAILFVIFKWFQMMECCDPAGSVWSGFVLYCIYTPQRYLIHMIKVTSFCFGKIGYPVPIELNS